MVYLSLVWIWTGLNSPVANVVPEFHAQHCVTLVVSVGGPRCVSATAGVYIYIGPVDICTVVCTVEEQLTHRNRNKTRPSRRR